ncbi:MAG: hypothetical protein V4654_08910 [Bdellovibrionota bacterium]
MQQKLPWLKSMQNGSIGEARTRAFLIDKFWILERSVDIEGADFLIQQKVSLDVLMKREPLRFGIVQSKFFENENTVIKIKEDYLIDSKGKTADQFFLVCHSGTSDSQKIYILTSDQIRTTFQKTDKVYHLRASKLENSQFEVTVKSITLNRMDSILSHSQFLDNARYVSLFFGYIKPDRNFIKPEFVEPIPNVSTDIKDAFFELKERAKKIIFSMEDVAEELQTIIKSDDPENAISLAEDFDSNYISRSGYSSLKISADRLFDQYLADAVNEHLEILYTLKEKNKLDRVLKIRETAVVEIYNFLSAQKSKPKETLVLEGQIDINTLVPKGFRLYFSSTKEAIVSDIPNGKLICIWPNHWWDKRKLRDKEWIDIVSHFSEEIGTQYIKDLIKFLCPAES